MAALASLTQVQLFGSSLYCPIYFFLNLIDELIIKCALHISDYVNGPSSELSSHSMEVTFP